ncbi:MAG: Flp pilus assembly protein CpaB [Aquihabitans sp.]
MVAALLVYNYVSGVEDDALGDAKQVPVFLVETKILRGSGGTEAQLSIVQENIATKLRPENAITNVDDIAGKVAITDLVPNQVVVADMFVDASDPRARASFSERLDQINGVDQVAVTISVDQIRGVAGLIEPGDYVNMSVTEVVQVGTDEGAAPPEGESQGDRLFAQQARSLFQKVRILAVGQSASPLAGQSAEEADAAAPTNSGLITLIVPAKAAAYIMSVPGSQIYLTLVAEDYVPVPQDPIDLNDMLPGEDDNQLTPYGKTGDGGE